MPSSGIGFGLRLAVLVLVCGVSSLAQNKKLDCAECHEVDPAAFQASVHSVLECADCHADVRRFPHEPAPAKVACAQCHAEVQQAHESGVHAAALRNGKSQAPGCAGCHGPPHAIRSSADPASPTHRASIPQTCGRCHGVRFVLEGTGLSAQPFLSYQQSVHGQAVAAGSEKAAVCTDCHRAHDVLPANNSRSRIFKFNVPATCGQCHEAVTNEFMASIHGRSVARGNWQAPVCTDCHGIHLIKPHIDPTSSVAAQALARTTCAQCHEGVRLAQEFGVPGRRASTYLDSYHGLASRLGSGVVANCASCHGVHNILPSSDPRSMVHKANLATTCGQCHPGAGVNFADGVVHVDAPLSRDMGSVGTRWVRRIYLVLIFATIGFMLVHNGILWRRKALLHRAALPRPVLRMTLNQRVQHWILLLSFILLALTGFALKYPDSWMAWLLGGSETFRRLAHRVAGAALLILGLYHAGYMLLTREGRQGLRDFRPVRRDLADLLHNLRFHLGLRGERPRFPRFSYAEKAEYLAVVWGTVLMGITGLMLWFEVQVIHWLPRWSIDIATAIHFYEAILAVLAILVWHSYHVMLDPDVYPLNWAFWDGRVPADHGEPQAAPVAEPAQAAEKAAESEADAKKKPAELPGEEEPPGA